MKFINNDMTQSTNSFLLLSLEQASPLIALNHFITPQTDGETVLNALKQVFYDPPAEPCDCEPQTDLLELPYNQSDIPRRTSAASSVSGNSKIKHRVVMQISSIDSIR